MTTAEEHDKNVVHNLIEAVADDIKDIAGSPKIMLGYITIIATCTPADYEDDSVERDGTKINYQVASFPLEPGATAEVLRDVVRLMEDPINTPLTSTIDDLPN